MKRTILHLICATMMLTTVTSRAEAPAPSVTGPMNADIPGIPFNFQFFFTAAMGPTVGRIEWTGDGIDGSKITCDWAALFPGIPSLILECSYDGGLPEGVEVGWTVNPAGTPDSELFKTADGTPIPETSGSFISPGESSGGPCDNPTPGGDTTSGGIIIIKTLHYIQTGDETPGFDPGEGAQFTAGVVSADIVGGGDPFSSASLAIPGGETFPLTETFGGVFSLLSNPATDPEIYSFNSEEEIDAMFPSGDYSMQVAVSGGGQQNIALPLATNDEVPIPTFTNPEVLQAFDGSGELTIEWNAFPDTTETDAIGLEIWEGKAELVYSAPDFCNEIELPASAVSHTVPAGTLEAGKSYRIILSFNKTYIADPTSFMNLPEVATVRKRTETVIGASNTFVRFTDIRLVGDFVHFDLEASIPDFTSFVVLYGSEDFETWEQVGVATSFSISPDGTLSMSEISPLSSLPPYRFYRAAIE